MRTLFFHRNVGREKRTSRSAILEVRSLFPDHRILAVDYDEKRRGWSIQIRPKGPGERRI